MSNIQLIANQARDFATRYATRFSFDHTLQGTCAVASAHLHTLCAEQGIKAKIIMTARDIYAHHCYVVLHNLLVDVTATQFQQCRHRPIVMELITRIPQTKEYWFWNNREQSFDSVQELRDHQQQYRWDKLQIPTPHNLNAVYESSH